MNEDKKTMLLYIGIVILVITCSYLLFSIYNDDHENVAGSITPHCFSCALRAGASSNYLLVNNERRPSARELLRLQGFPDTYKIVLSYGHIKKQTGNSVAVPVIKAVAKKMLEALREYGECKSGQK